MSSEEIEYLVSGPPFENRNIFNGDDEGFIKFDFETQSVFKRLADDIYQSEAAGIREPLTNSITAVLQAKEEFGVENPQIEITVEDGTPPTVSIRDNGVGISEKVIKEVMSVIGRSMHRGDGTLSGKYGMGFLACYKLVGTNGGFIMHSRSRRTRESISGAWTPSGFSKDTDSDLSNPFEESGTFGTELQFMLKEGITKEDIRGWVKQNAKFARLPIIYREFNEAGEAKYNEDYGGFSIEDEYSEDTRVISIETDAFDAYISKDNDSRTLLLDAPIRRNNRVSVDPWGLDIRLKNENGVVVSGPNEGLEPIDEREYEQMDEATREKFIPESKLEENDIRLPSPTGTRDSLGPARDFWDWLTEEIRERAVKETADIIGKTEGTVSSFMSLPEDEQEMAVNTYDAFYVSKRQSHVIDELNKYTSENITDSHVNLMDFFVSELKEIDWDEYNNNLSVSDYMVENTWLWEIHSREGEVYMAVRPPSEKINVIYEDSTDNTLVILRESSAYEDYKSILGWNKLTYVGPSTIDEFDVSNKTRKPFAEEEKSEEDDNNDMDKDLTLYYGRTRESKSMDVHEVITRLEQGHGIVRHNPHEKLVLFPRNRSANLSDNYELASGRTTIASCTKSQWEVLRKYGDVVPAEYYLHDKRHVELSTSEGTMIAREVDFSKAILHPVKGEVIDYFRKEEIMDGMVDFIESGEVERLDPQRGNIVYIPLTKGEMDEMRHLIDKNNTIILSGDLSYDLGVPKYYNSDTRGYAYSRLPDWRGMDIMNQFEKSDASISNGGIELVETLAIRHDRGESPKGV